jgi:hypothetical protein
MGPFPFIRFEQAEINGNFGDEYAYRKTQIQVLNALFVDNYFNGDKFFIAVNEIKNEIQLLNDAPTFASLELILPSPYPTSVGVEVYTLKIGIQQNNECFIEILFNLTDGIVTANDTTFTAGPDLVEVTTNRPFIAEELKIAKTLSVYQQNGAAIFPDTFDFDATTGIAERRLLRAYDWEYNTSSNQPQREGVTDLRMIPKTVFRLRELLQIEKAMVSFFLEKPIKQSIIEDIWNAKNIYLTPLPEDWTFDFITHSLTKKQLSISSAKYGISLILAGIKVSDLWYFQRFVNPNYTKTNIQTSFEWIIAMNSLTGEYRNVGDIMSLIDVNLSDIIIYGANEQFTPQTEIITIPFASLVTFPTTVLFADSIINYLNANGLPTTYTIATISGEQVVKFVTTATIAENGIVAVTSFDNAPFSYAIFEGAPPNLAQGLSGTIPSNPDYGKLYSTDYYYDYDQCEFGTVVNEEPFNLLIKSGDNYQINVLKDFIFEPEIGPEKLIGIFDCNGTFIQKIGEIGFPAEDPVIPTQYQASITIPPLANSNYFIGIYQAYESEGQNYATLLAMSQSLALDNFEDFTQMLEYGSAQDSIIEGFEYLNGWLQRIRVPLNGAGQTYSLEESIYRNSDGTFQKPQNSTDENISLHTDYLDLQTQRAMTSATRHPIFVLANQNLSVQGDLEIATNQDYTTNQSFRKLQQMRFQAKNQGYQPNNNSCLG